MAVIVQILSPFPTLPNNAPAILLTGKGVNQVTVNAETFDVHPYEDPYAQGVVAGYVSVLTPGFIPGVYKLAPNSGYIDAAGNTLLTLEMVNDFPRNKYT